MTVTIRDVARKLNLSITTVSRALDGYSDVSEETRQRVIAVAHEMGYVPNKAARQLRRQRTDTLGFILPARTPRFNEPFYSDFIAGLADEAADQNMDLMISSAPPEQSAEQAIYQRWVQERKTDGIVLNQARLHDWRIQYLAERQIPFVTLERSLDPFEYASVEVDGRGGFAALVAHLVDCNWRRIAYVGTESDLKLQADRFAGYQDGLAAAGLPLDESLIVQGRMTSQGGYQAAQKLLSLPEPPTAIACVSDQVAIGVLHAAHEHGLVVGRDLAVAGFDGIDESAHTQPPLTTLRQPVYEIARKLAGMLITQISGQALEQTRVRLEPELIIRASTGG